MHLLVEIAGVVACCSVAVRYTHRGLKLSPAYVRLLTEGKETMTVIAEKALQHCVNWNIHQRDHARAHNNCHGARHFQQNIDRLNDQLRQIDRNN